MSIGDMFREMDEQVIQHTPVASPVMREYFNKEVHSLYQGLQQVDSSYLQGISQTIAVYNDENRIYNTQLVVSDAEQYIDGESIYVVNTNNVMGINHTMKRYVMVNPEIRTMYDNDDISGFGGKFIDRSPYEDEYEWCEDYLDVIDGLSLPVDGNEEEIATIYDSDAPLTSLEQFNIQESWSNMLSSISNGVDPTDIEEI